MPHINRIRVNNVKYNFGTQFYDDFILRFDGKNALYDLANGGGKSVLMLLLFQNLIPNCTLDDKQPIEKLFRTDQGSKTIHSLIEWKLDSRFVHDQYKYMLTGFCARKAREELRETAAVEYFNYVIFYRGYNDNDIVNLPLSNDKERITYTGLKSYLKELGRRDMGLEVHVFDRKGEYQRFISRYGLYESHWEILRGINKTEGHVRTYFETRYRTTRKVVEDLLIEEIIQKAFGREDHSEGDMADTLVRIKDKLTELAERKKEICAYDRQTEILENFSGGIERLKDIYKEKESLDTDMVKTYHTLTAVNHRNEKALAVFQKEKEFAEKHIREISRKLDTVKIQENQEHLQRLEADTEAYARDIQQLKEIWEKQRRALDLAESRNDYDDYLKARRQWEAVREFLAQDGRENDGILQELQMLARLRFVFDREEKKALTEKMEAVNRIFEETEAGRDAARDEERRLFSEGAVLESQAEEARTQEREAVAQMGQLCRKVPVLILEDIGKTLREKKQQRAENALKMKAHREQQELQAQAFQSLSKRLEESRETVKRLTAEEGELKDFLSAYAMEKEKLKKLLEVYHVQNDEALAAAVGEQFRKAVLDGELKRREIKRLERELVNLRQGIPTVPNPAAEAVVEYIRRCHGLKCVFGGDYLKDVSDYDRRILLERIPFLPESVILESGMSELREDRVLLEKDFGDGVVPVIRLNPVLEQAETVSGKDVLFLSKNPELYLDEKAREEVCRKTEKAVEEVRTALERLEDREKTIEADRYYITGVELNYRKYAVQRSLRLQETITGIEAVRQKIAEDEAGLESCRLESERTEKAIEMLQAEADSMDEALEVLEEMRILDGTLEKLRLKIRRLTEALDKNKKQQQAAQEKFETAQEGLKQLDGQKKALNDRFSELEAAWKNLYEAYYSEGEAEKTDMTAEAADARFRGLKEAYEKEHSDLEDKKRLMENYRQMMEKSLQMIEKRGTDPALLETMAREHRLVRAEAAETEALEKELERLKSEMDIREGTLFRYQENKNKLFGSVAQGVRTIEEKYGSFEQIPLQNEDYSAFEIQQKRALEAVLEKKTKAEEGIERTWRELRSCDDVKRDLERTIRNENILFNRTKDTYGMELDIRKKYRELNEKYLRLRTELQRKREGYEKDRVKAAEELRLIAASELSEAIRREAVLPESFEDASVLIQQMKETAAIIRLEKDRIEKTIQDMMQIKENFEKQCLQRCLSIRAELERFPAYSKIMLDGRQIPMVMLKIPYVKEEMYSQRMSEYIDGIVERTDTYSSPEERVAYIRQQLSWKRLFSVIVTDVNSIRLNLYKRERVKEQSRYLKYEEAVGSTGQSQGIYIQFLIGVINYISMIYSGGGDGSDLQKVIFIDNPFGAAKDIYIWQPIFELLRTNHVQLIVPTRGATPAITGKFDVNYVLGQKMIDKMQQTVIVDYSSNVDVASMEYEKLEFEQEVFDFI